MLDQKKLDELNQKIYDNGYVDRADLLDFLTLIPTTESVVIIEQVKSWLQQLHNNPKYDKINFPADSIEQILGDLDSYGRVQPDTIMKFKESNPKTVPIV